MMRGGQEQTSGAQVLSQQSVPLLPPQSVFAPICAVDYLPCGFPRGGRCGDQKENFGHVGCVTLCTYLLKECRVLGSTSWGSVQYSGPQLGVARTVCHVTLHFPV